MSKLRLILVLSVLILGTTLLPANAQGITPQVCQAIAAIGDFQQIHQIVFSYPNPNDVFSTCYNNGSWTREFVAQVQAYGATIEVEHGTEPLGGLETGEGASSIHPGLLDMVFVIDTTGSMQDDIDQAKARAQEIINQVASSGTDWRIGVVTYRDYPDGRHGETSDYQARVESDFSNNAANISWAINNIRVDGGADDSESVYSGLMTAMSLSWRHGAQKVLVLMGDAPPHNPEPGTGFNEQQVLTTAFNLDPVNIYPIVINNAPYVYEAFSSLADGSSGRMFSTSEAIDLVPVLLSTIETATGRNNALYVGARARVYTTEGDTLRVRSGPGTRNAELDRLPIHTVVDIIGGPAFEYPYVWWQVRGPSGIVGWSVEAADGIVTLINVDSTLDPNVFNVGILPPNYRGSCGPDSLLSIGSRAIVTNQSVDYVYMRSTPEIRDGNYVATLPNGTVVDVVGGPYVGSNYLWWAIRANGVIGYSVELHCDGGGAGIVPNNLSPY